MEKFTVYEHKSIKFNYDTEKKHFFLQDAKYPESTYRWKSSSEVMAYIDKKSKK